MSTKLSELDQASADRRSFGNPALAANAELKVIAEAMRELVLEVRLVRVQLAAIASVAGALAEPAASVPTDDAQRVPGTA
jgi:hypothetical protein